MVRARPPARVLAGALAAAALLGACGSSGASSSAGADSASEPVAPSTRSFTHAFGTSEIPTQPERVVTTTDQNALLPLLEVGYTPVGSAGLVDEESGEQIFRRTDGFDTGDVTFVGAYGEPNVEAIAALEPDLIVGYEYDADYADQLEAVAPFVGIQVFGRRLSEALLDFADVVGKRDVAEALQAEYDARIADVRERIDAAHPDLTVSIVAPDVGQVYLGDEGQAIGTVAYDLDLGRPKAQADADRLGGSFTDGLSLELIEQWDADVVIVLDFGGDAAAGGYDPATTAFLESPLVQRLQAAKRDQLVVVDGSRTVGAAWVRMHAFLDDLEEVLLADDLVSTGVNG